MTKPQIAFNGIPTDHEIERIRDRWPDGKMIPGTTISYSQMESCLGLKRHTSRFKTVTDRWRKLAEKDSQVFIGCERGQGFVVLDDKGKLGLSASCQRGAVKKSRRSYIVAAHIDVKQLSIEDRAKHEHIQRRAAAIMAVAQIRRTADLPTLT